MDTEQVHEKRKKAWDYMEMEKSPFILVSQISLQMISVTATISL